LSNARPTGTGPDSDSVLIDSLTVRNDEDAFLTMADFNRKDVMRAKGVEEIWNKVFG
jgi:hypothetical protein